MIKTNKVGLISCVKSKKDYTCRAEEMYSKSTLFNYSLKYLKKLECEYIYILSAKYGLLDLNTIISPYNQTLLNSSEHYKNTWYKKIISDLNRKHNLKNDKFIIVAGIEYYKGLLPYLKDYEIPLKGMTIGKRLKYLKNITKNG